MLVPQKKKKKKIGTGEECKGKVRKLNSAIARNVGGTTDAGVGHAPYTGPVLKSVNIKCRLQIADWV